MTDVKITKNDAGDVFVGFDADGTFVPFANVSASRITQLQERHADLAAKLEKGDLPAQEAAQSLPFEVATSKSTSSTKGGAS